MSIPKAWILRGAVLLLILAVAAAVVLSRRSEQAPPFVSKLDRQPVIALKLNPDVAESLRNLGRSDAAYFHSWPIQARKELSPDESARVRQVLEAASTYGEGDEQCFEAEAAFRFGAGSAGAAEVELLISSRCRRIQLVESGASRVAEF